MASETPAKGARHAIRIGKYEILTHIATGGMGAVYKALDVDLGREVALKVLPPEIAARPDMLERFRREAHHAAQLRYKHIVSVYDFGEANGTFFLALEFVDGIDLLEYIRRKGPLHPKEARSILIQAAKALLHAHRHGIVHRDVKPSNFLITQRKGRPFVRLTDLGLARGINDNDFRVTVTGVTVGTVDYMSPEQARDSRAADSRSDIYSLGCTLYHMLTGRPPFAEGSLTERLYKHIQAEPPDVRPFNPQVTESLTAILRRMLAKDPADRYQTPHDLLQDLLRDAGRPGGSSILGAGSSGNILRGAPPGSRGGEPEELKTVPSLSNRELLAALARGTDDDPPRRRGPLAPPSRRLVPSPSRDGDEEDAEDANAGTDPALPTWLPFAAAGAIALLAALVALVIAVWSGQV
jgi:serine/threonine protein kinase